MSAKIFLLASTSISIVSMGMAISTPAFSQETEETVEEVIVTGSYIRRPSQQDSSSPISVIGMEEFRNIGAQTIADITQTLTINTGAQNNPDAFTQNFSTGTSNINLRGLGVSSTLVLLNGRRQVVSGAVTDQGLTFVDTSSLIPMIAVERIETLEDGAAALYGTDAVAGVVNFVTRDDFEGFEASLDYQTVTEDSQSDYRLQAIFGAGSERGHITAAVSYLNRTPLTTGERRMPGSLNPIYGDFSNAGQPGSFIVPSLPTGLPDALQAAWTSVFDSAGIIDGVADAFEPMFGAPAVEGAITPAFADSNCAAGENSVVPDTFPIGLCRLDFGSFYSLVPKEDRLNAYTQARYNINDNIEIYGEAAFARNRAERRNTPSFPITNPLGIAEENPFNPYGVDVLFVGRPIGQGGAAISTHDSDTYRIQAGLRGDFRFGWNWDVSYTRAINDFNLTVPDTLVDRFTAALVGLGGPGCNPVTDLPGQGACQFFNPFGSALTAGANDTVPFNTMDADGNPITIQVPVANNQDVIDDFTARMRVDAESTLSVVDLVTTGDIMEMSSGRMMAGALGFQFRGEHFSQDYDANANRDNFLFLVGNPDFGQSRDIYAAFGELFIPLLDELDVQLALRYEDYGNGIGSTLDPKIAALYRVNDMFALRGSFNTAFRAPSIFQTSGGQTSLQQLTDTLPGQPATPQFRAVRTTGNPNLQPEQSEAWNAGFTVSNNGYEINMDYWRFDFEDVIIQQNAQALINSDPTNPAILRSATGTLLQVNSEFVNAASLFTDGIDASASYTWESDRFGALRLGGELTYILNYDLVDPQAGRIEGAGSRNFTNFGTSTPEWRWNTSLHWAQGVHSANIYGRFIGGYNNDQVPGSKIDSHFTVDLQYSLTVPEEADVVGGVTFTVGAINIFDNKVPVVLTNGGYDSKVHDPRQRMIYFSARKAF